MYFRPIGICDSGLGGLSVWSKIIQLLPGESTIYAADHAYLPYGKLTTEQIKERAVHLIRWLIDQGSKAIVVACNTATVAGIGYYRTMFPDIPIIGVVPVIKAAAQMTKTGHIAVMSTAYTAGSAYQKSLLAEFAGGLEVITIACPNLVDLIETGDLRSQHIARELDMLLAPVTLTPVDILVLGCTHYPFIKTQIGSIVGSGVTVIDSGDAVARQLGRILEHNFARTIGYAPEYAFYTTGHSAPVTRVARVLINRKIQFHSLTI